MERVLHGNSNVDKEFLPTLPSVRRQIKEKIRTEKSNEKVLIDSKKTLKVFNGKLNEHLFKKL